MTKEETKLAVIEIKVSAFCDEYLNPVAEESLAALFDACIESEALNLMRGDPDVWAAGIAYAFCRMNFLLDGGSPAGLSLERDEFFTFLRAAIVPRSPRRQPRLSGSWSFITGIRFSACRM